MEFQVLDTDVLGKDLPQHGLRRGDLGAVVHLHGPDALGSNSLRHPAEPKRS